MWQFSRSVGIFDQNFLNLFVQMQKRNPVKVDIGHVTQHAFGKPTNC